MRINENPLFNHLVVEALTDLCRVCLECNERDGMAVFFSVSPHVGAFDIRVYGDGWSSVAPVDLSISQYIYGDAPLQDALHNIETAKRDVLACFHNQAELRAEREAKQREKELSDLKRLQEKYGDAA